MSNQGWNPELPTKRNCTYPLARCTTGMPWACYLAKGVTIPHRTDGCQAPSLEDGICPLVSRALHADAGWCCCWFGALAAVVLCWCWLGFAFPLACPF